MLSIYNFVIIGYNSDLYKTSYNDVVQLACVRYVPDFITAKRPKHCLIPKANLMTYLLYRLHHSSKVNRIFNIPFKNVWFGHYYKNDFKDDKPLCFLFFSRNIILEKYGFIKFLKKKHPGSKFVCFFQDLVCTHEDITLSELKSIFDLVITFDNHEAGKYGFEHFPLVASRCKYDLSSEIKESDVYFLGVAKNRLNDIITAYERLKEKGLKCDFHVAGVAKEDQVYSDEISYINSMSYLDNLQRINKAKCMLELMQKNGHGYTQRMMEAIIYDKKIITNNPMVKDAPFYNPANILHIDRVDSITDNVEFYSDFSRKADHAYKDEISPIRLLEFVAGKLQSLKENAL